MRFVFEPPENDIPVRLAFSRWLRPMQRYVLRMRLEEETTSRFLWLERGFFTPQEAQSLVAQDSLRSITGEELGLERRLNRASVLLLPPPQEILFGLQRFEAIVVGESIRKLRFLLDGKPQVTRSGPPWGAELRLPAVPKETWVRVEGLSESGEVVAADELLLNQRRGEPRVRLLEPKRRASLGGVLRAKAAVVVPEDRRLDSVEFVFNGQVIARRTEPPWEVEVDTSGSGPLAYLSVVARFSDGATIEDVRVFGQGAAFEELDVELVELYVSVVDSQGRIIRGLPRSQFVLEEEGRPRSFERFEEVKGLPLRVGLILDTSGSMREMLELARGAAVGFLKSVLTPKDLGFTVAFSDRPRLLMPLVSDPGALELSLRDVVAEGNTALYDALVLGLYQLRSQRGQRALVLLSDGEDTASTISFEDALGFARASGVSIYTIGLNIGSTSFGIRSQLSRLASETGGRVFYVARAEELPNVYRQIEEELRSRYLLAFAPDPQATPGQFRRLRVKLRDPSLKARHAPGYAREP
jgi:VWFA-related protein